MKSFLVIGSNSFSGSHFINLLLNKNFKVWGISRSKELGNEFLLFKNHKNLRNYKFNLLNLNKLNDRKKIIKIVKDKKIKNVVNFAAQGMVEESFKNPCDWYNTNLLSTVDFVERLKNLNIENYLHITTPEVYGNIKTRIFEDSRKNPSTPYAISRLAMDYHLHAIHKVNNFPVKFSRAANVYGEGQQLYRIIPKTILKILTKEKLYLHGSGLSKRSFVHISDISEGYYKILMYGKKGHTYHLADENFISIKQLVKRISDKLGVNYKKNIIENTNDRLGKDYIYKLDASKIAKELKWSPKIDLDTGLNNTISWIKKNFSKFKNSDLEYKHKK